MIKTIPATPAVTGRSEHGNSTKMEKACAEFESIFINHMLKSMRDTVSEDGLLGDSNESKIIRSMFDENLSRGIAKSGGFGLGKMLFESLKT